jgi:hypothetical protein
MASTAVNSPTNLKLKEQDVNNKLQVYGIVTGMSAILSRVHFGAEDSLYHTTDLQLLNSFRQWQSPICKLGSILHKSQIPD